MTNVGVRIKHRVQLQETPQVIETFHCDFNSIVTEGVLNLRGFLQQRQLSSELHLHLL